MKPLKPKDNQLFIKKIEKGGEKKVWTKKHSYSCFSL